MTHRRNRGHRNFKKRHLHWTLRTGDFVEDTSVRARVDSVTDRGVVLTKPLYLKKTWQCDRDSGKVGTVTRMTFYGH